MAARKAKTRDETDDPVSDYRHEATRPNNPPAALASQGTVREVPKQRYHYDPHLSPALRFDDTGQADRVRELLDAARYRTLTDEEADFLDQAAGSPEPWLEWAGKREGQPWFEVDPVSLHIHERVSAQAAVRVAARQNVQRGLWADPELDYHEAVQFYQYNVPWANRLILGDSLAVMNSLAVRENMVGKVQMIYVDPPYGIRFASNFQPFVRNRNVTDREADLTREPEMVKAYRDTWTLGVHTYLAYLRDRLTVARDLLTDSGSIFVQIGDENVHRVRAVMDEVFGSDAFIGLISYRVFGVRGADFLDDVTDNILWYAKQRDSAKHNRLFLDDRTDHHPDDCGPVRLFRPGYTDGLHFGYEFQGRTYSPPMTMHWATNRQGLDRLSAADRMIGFRADVRYRRFHRDFPVKVMTTNWNDTWGEQTKVFAVQTATKVIQRCMLMTTDPGDLVLDPTCGSGTTAYVAEQWGRRWITIDTSRVAVALARERILTAKFDYYKTPDGSNSIGSAGFVYETVPHIMLRDIAQNVALDPIFEKWDPVLDERLAALNASLPEVTDEVRTRLLAKLDAKRRKRGERVIDADERRWRLPQDRWEHWEVPFDTDPDWPAGMKERLESYRKAWRGKMDEVDACIAASAKKETLVDRPEVERGVVRVSGPFTIESVHPPEESLGLDSPIGGAPERMGAGDDAFDTDDQSNVVAFHDNLTGLLANDEVRFQGNGSAKFMRLERLAEGEVLHADGEWENGVRVAVSFGPQYGPVTAKQVEASVRAANMRGYDALVFAGFSFDGAAQAAIQADAHTNVRVHMAHVSPDVNMGDLLKQTKDSQLFSVSGLPRTKLTRQDDGEYVIEMEGVDIFDPVENTIMSEGPSGVAAWFLDADYDGRTFVTTQAFFPDSNAWDKLARALKSAVDPEAFAAFGGTESLPFPRGEHDRAAVKVIDPRGNEVMKIHELE